MQPFSNGAMAKPTEHHITGKDKGSDTFDLQGKKFANKQLHQILFLEVFAGSARLTRAARAKGFNGLAIDHTNQRTQIDVVNYDLGIHEHVQDLIQLITEQANDIAFVWFAPPCGTASRAREKPIPAFKGTSFKTPQPLRSVDCPDQLDGLEGLDKIKVEVANQIYESVFLLAITCDEHNVPFAIENPKNSHFWNTTPMKQLRQRCKIAEVLFHNCAHGGSRDKLTMLWCNNNILYSLQLFCDGQHPHSGWKPKVLNNAPRYATSEEAAYPELLCARIVDAVLAHVQTQGAIVALDIASDPAPDDTLGRTVLGALPRGLKAKPLVSEFGTYYNVVVPAQHDKLLTGFLQTCPKGARITSRRLMTRGELRVEDKWNFLGDTQNQAEHVVVECCWIGIPSDPDEFLRRALKAGRPRSLDVHVGELAKKLVQENLTDSPHLLAHKRIQFIKRWSQRAKDLAEKESLFQSNLPEHVQNVIKGKRLLLLGEMLEAVDYPDKKLVADISQGFQLHGFLPSSGVFPSRVKRPPLTMNTLKKLAKGLNQSSLSAVSKRQEGDLEEEAWKETQNEIEKGWVFEDPNTAGVFIGRRFGLRQSEKIRVIDDCSCSGYNATVGLREKLKLQTVDYLAAVLGYGLKILGPSNKLKLLGKCYDLKSAYKQFAISSEDRSMLRVAVAQPNSQQPRILGFNALPFGAVGSVAGFLRISLAVWFIGATCLGLLWSAFYDDYSVVTRSELASSCSWAVESLFQLLGLKYATEGKKNQPFAPSFKMLGLQLDLEMFGSKGEVRVGRTQSRRDELVSTIAEILSTGKLDSKKAERLRGRMIFFEGYTFGRLANTAIKCLGRYCHGFSGAKRIDSQLESSLRILTERVLTGPPVCVTCTIHDSWFVFTDGACEPEKRQGSIGGVLVNPHGHCVAYFGLEICSVLMDKLLEVSENPIHELEVLPVLLATSLWASHIRNTHVVFYVDNESARMAYIRGTGNTGFAAKWIQLFLALESDLVLKPWFARVPTHSNVADPPSRMSFGALEEMGAERTSVDWEVFLARLL